MSLECKRTHAGFRPAATRKICKEDDGSRSLTQSLAEIQRVNAYSLFQKQEGVPVYGGFAVDDLRTVELGQWARKGGRGAYINLDGTGGTNDAYVAEIRAAGR